MKVPFLDLHREYEEIKTETEEALQSVISSQQFILGDYLLNLEKEISGFLGAKEAVGVSSGTDALILSLLALGIGPGDEVITPAFSFFASAGALLQVGASPVFADAGLETFNIDFGDAERRVTKSTKAIIAVHLFGAPVDLDPFIELCEERGLFLIEDCAQSFGTTFRKRFTGTIGTLGALSFYPTKNLAGWGDGGMVVEGHSQLARSSVPDSFTSKVRLLRHHGASPEDPYLHILAGRNSRLDEIQAAVLLVKMKRMKENLKRRRAIADIYLNELQSVPQVKLQQVPDSGEHSFNLFTLRVEERSQLKKTLKESGISTSVYYPRILPAQPVFANHRQAKERFPNAERLADGVLSIPLFPQLTEDEAYYVVGKIKDFYKVSC